MIHPLSDFQVRLLAIVIEASPIGFKQQIFNFLSHYNAFLRTFENRQKIVIEQFILKELLKSHGTNIPNILKGIYSTSSSYIPREVSLKILKEHCQKANVDKLLENTIQNNLMINILMNPFVKCMKRWIRNNSLAIIDMNRSAFSQKIDGIDITFISHIDNRKFRRVVVDGTIEMISNDKFFEQVFTEFFTRYNPSFKRTDAADLALRVVFNSFFTKNSLTTTVEDFKTYFLSKTFNDTDRTWILKRIKNKLSERIFYAMPSLSFLDE